MPELPEVQTTVDGLNRTVKGRKILSVWTDYESAHSMHSESVKNPAYFKKFKRLVIGTKIKKVRRRAKNILIDLSNGETLLVHMKMTGHFVYDPKPDYPYVHLAFTLDNGKRLVFSDLRKFAKVSVIETNEENESKHLKGLGPEPLDKKFTFTDFESQIKKKLKGKIKQVLMDQTVIAGIGNIYSDEILWRAGVHPLSRVEKIPTDRLKAMYLGMKEVLQKGIKLGGDSTSDYRNIKGEPGAFQARHNAYRRTGKPCKKPLSAQAGRCNGIIERIVVGGRSAHFCPVHQRVYK